MTSQDEVETITAAQLRADCDAVLEKVRRTGKGIVITKRDRPIAVLMPHQASDKPKAQKITKRSPLGVLKGQLEITGDIVSPVYAEWAQDIDAELKKRGSRDT
jgi:prevent-host-death family protein